MIFVILEKKNYTNVVIKQNGMLLHIGYDDLCNNEQFVQAMGNAICQGFDIKEVNRE